MTDRVAYMRAWRAVNPARVAEYRRRDRDKNTVRRRVRHAAWRRLAAAHPVEYARILAAEVDRQHRHV